MLRKIKEERKEKKNGVEVERSELERQGRGKKKRRIGKS